jgi:hypothetical protein
VIAAVCRKEQVEAAHVVLDTTDELARLRRVGRYLTTKDAVAHLVEYSAALAAYDDAAARLCVLFGADPVEYGIEDITEMCEQIIERPVHGDVA